MGDMVMDRTGSKQGRVVAVLRSFALFKLILLTQVLLINLFVVCLSNCLLCVMVFFVVFFLKVCAFKTLYTCCHSYHIISACAASLGDNTALSGVWCEYQGVWADTQIQTHTHVCELLVERTRGRCD